MKTIKPILLAVLCMLFTATYATQNPLTKYYVQNAGQVKDEAGKAVPGALFYNTAGQTQLFITRTGYAVVYKQKSGNAMLYNTIEVKLEGAAISKEQIVFTEAQAPVINAYYGSEVNENIKTARTFIIRNIYQGVDWLWSFDAKGNPKHEFMVNVGADASKIKYTIKGAAVSAHENTIEYRADNFRLMEGPVVYDYLNKDVTGGINLKGNQLSFNIPASMAGGGFTIDPALETIWGLNDTSIHTVFRSIDVTKTFETITVGATDQYLPVFPQVSGSYTAAIPATQDVMIMKTDSNQDLIWATYLGGVNNDGANAVAACPAGIFITGYSQSWNFPQAVSGNYNRPVDLIGQDAFIAKFDNEGKWKWTTGYGGSGSDEGIDIKYFNGKIYVAGLTHSFDFPLLSKSGAYNSTSLANSTNADGFLLEFDTLGNRSWATCFGRLGNDAITSIDVDNNGVYTTGYTNSDIDTLRLSGAYFQAGHTGVDGFITLFDPAGALQWSTYFGGNGSDYPGSILKRPCGLFIAGKTNGSGLPVLSQNNGNYYRPNYSGGSSDGFLARLDANTLQNTWCTYYGTTNADVLTKMTTDSACALIVTGFSNGAITNVGNPLYFFEQPGNYGGYDAVMLQFGLSQNLVWATHFGTDANDFGLDVKPAIDGAVDMVGEGIYNYGLFRIGGTYTTTPCFNQVLCPRVTCNGVSNRFLFIDSISGRLGGGAGSGGGGGVGGGGCNNYLFFQALIPEKNTCPNQCNGRAHIDTANIVGCPPYTLLWNNGHRGVSDSTLCEFYWSRVIDGNLKIRTIYNRFNVLRVPPIPAAETYCGIVPLWDSLIQPLGGGPPYTIDYRGIIGDTCPGQAYFNIIDTAQCIVSYAVEWKRYDEGVTFETRSVSACSDQIRIRELAGNCRGDSFAIWRFVFINGTDTLLVQPAIYDEWRDLALPDSSANYTVYLDKGACETPSQTFFKQGVVKHDAYPLLACHDSVGSIKVVLQPDAAAINSMGSYDVTVGLYSANSSVFVDRQDLHITTARVDTVVFENLPPGIYYVAVFPPQFALDSCPIKKDSVNLTLIDIKVNRPSVFCGQSNSLIASASGGFPPYNYQWSHTGVNNDTVGVNTPGDYSVSVTDQDGCGFSVTVSVPGSSAVVIDSVRENTSPCEPNLFSRASVDVSGGTQPYSYVWSSGEISANAQFLPQGNNYVRVTDALNCTDIAYFVNTKQMPVIVTATSTNVTCSGSADGSAQLDITYGYPPYQITWSNGSHNDSIFNLTEGIYTYRVTDSTGCMRFDTVKITESAPLDLNVTTLAATCIDSNGAAQVTVSGGHTPITISWNDGDVQFARNNMFAGQYLFTITDANGCNLTDTAFVDTISPLTAQIFKNDITCNGDGDGSASVIVFNAIAPVVYHWSTNDSIPFLANLDGGDYSVTVTDRAGCQYSTNINIYEPDPFIATATITTEIYCNGQQAVVSVDGQGGNYPYSGVGNNFLPAGQYDFVITDDKNCEATTSIDITEPPLLEINTVVTNAYCNDLGSVEFFATGGVAPYSTNGGLYQFNSSYVLDSLSPGAYSFFFYDDFSCGVNADVVIDGYTQPDASLSVTDITCNGLNNGEVNVQITQGYAPFTVQGVTYNNGYTASGLAAGTYSYNVIDSAGCAVSFLATVSEPTPLVVSVDTGSGVSCTGFPAFVTITASGGTPPYNGTGNYNLTGGAHQYTITDNAGCTADINFTLTDPIALQNVLDVIQPSCNDTAGSVHITSQGGTGPYTVVVNSISYGPYTDTIAVAGLGAGQYSVAITDAVGCTDYQNAFISVYSAPLATFSTANVSCYGLHNGAVTIAISNGVTPYYVNGAAFTTGQTIDTFAAGSYTLVVSDFTGCGTDTVDFIISQPDSLIAFYSIQTNIVCAGDSLGAFINASGGVYPYTGVGSYTYFTGAVTQTVTDGNGCIANVSFTVVQPAVLTVDTVVLQPNCSFGNGSVKVKGAGGEGPYLLFNGLGSSPFADSISLNLPAGNYSYRVVDSRGCEKPFNFTIGNVNAQAQIAFTNTPCFGQQLGIATITITGSSSQFSVNGQVFTDSLVIDSLEPGYYQYNVIDVNGCNFVLQGTVLQPSRIIINPDLVQHGLTCYNRNDGAIAVTATGGTPTYTYGLITAPGDTLWQASSAFNGLGAGGYTVIVRDNNLCNATAGFGFAPFERGQSRISIDTIDCYGSATGAISISSAPGSRGPYTYSLNGGDTQQYNVFYNLLAGDYVVEIKDSAGCADTLYANIPQPDSIDGRVWLNGELLPHDSSLMDLRNLAVFTKESSNPWRVVLNPNFSAIVTTDTLIQFNPRESAAYVVYVYKDALDSSCYISYTGFIGVNPVPFLPDLMTPNGDGFNDSWEVDLDKYGGSEVTIFDRWGEIVFESGDYRNEWSGAFRNTGRRVPDGTYFYILKPAGAEAKAIKGAINILNSSN